MPRGICSDRTTRSGAPEPHRPHARPVPHKKLPHKKVKLPERSKKGAYDDQASIKRRRFVPERYDASAWTPCLPLCITSVTTSIAWTSAESSARTIWTASRVLLKEMGRKGLRTVRLLVVLEGFEGWDSRSSNWSDLTFYVKHGDRLERIAIVGDERWRDHALMFAAADLRRGPVEFFAIGAMSDARAWLSE